MPTTRYDLDYLKAGIEVFESYLLSADIYWPVGVHAPRGEKAYPQLTLGGMLLAQRRLQATAQTTSQQAELTKYSLGLDVVRQRYRVAWGKKAAAEFPARLNLWRDYWQDYRESSASHYDRFPYEVNRRVMLELLLPEAEPLPTALTEALHGLDGALRVVLIAGEFIWELDLQSAFPVEPFWYLYGRLPR